MKYLCLLLFVTGFVLYPLNTPAQQAAPPDMSIDAATRAAVIENLLKELNDSYVFSETAKKMEADVQNRIKIKEYDGIATARAFADKLTADLQSVSKDKHLRVRFSAKPIPVRGEKREPTAEEIAQSNWFNKRVNFGFEKVERLNGNVGYINLLGFNDPEAGAATVAAAMSFVANTDALIIDLRQNGGGDPAMVALICSYLFGDKPVHLNDLYWRKGDKTEEFWTKPTVAGKKYGSKDVYVLTSSRTFSGAEEFSYNLKNLKRATIIGETTGGGAHPGGMVRLNQNFGVFIPSGRAISPITKTNWEGTGVEPDIKVPKEQALKTAYSMALTKLVETTKEENIKAAIKQDIEKLQKELEEMRKTSQK
ncbi:MAG: S41 family peptidase [Saprospiraceae bacterium]|nr:S41 family peptidase [Pyrinomonadaceae bacterium]